ncbi:hypothetical protein F4553_003750 [Allocatelliglobosispora scoriae]|uniref:Uncharacterized protein n=1 Tax=Allocatelliglobosispora scoriae TaxID=643052 RepID=A0A841BUD6_9ACTN|nr:hypothetical protein [Allocatelliglobosispora scoriae]
MLDLRHGTHDDLATLQLASNRHHSVTGGDVAGCRLGQEGLVRHVWLGIDDDHFGLTSAELARHAQSCIEPDMSGTNDQDALRFHIYIFADHQRITEADNGLCEQAYDPYDLGHCASARSPQLFKSWS